MEKIVKKGNAVPEASENGGMRKKERNIADGGQNADGRKNTENKDTESVSEKNKTAEKAGKILIALLRNELSGEIPVFTEEERVFFTPQNLITLYRLADAHDLAHLAGEALLNAGITVPEKIADAFRRKLALACYRYERMNHDIGRIYAAFDAEKVDYVPLKGAVIRRYYPDPAMRTSCDVDILVREKDLKRAISVLQEKSLVTSCKKAYHDYMMTTDQGVTLELHFSLSELHKKHDRVTEKVWDYVIPEEEEKESASTCRMKMTNEFFFAYLISHAAYHFLGGGCGVRTFMDLYLLKNALPFDREKLKELLRLGDLEKFGNECFRLADLWFGTENERAEAEGDEIAEEMAKFVLCGGVYGSASQSASMKQAQAGGKTRAIMRRIWAPKEELKMAFPVLEKHPWLLPFFQFRRWCRLLFGRKRQKRVMSELKENLAVDNETREKTKRLKSDLHL